MKRYNIEDMNNIAILNDGVCVSKIYSGWKNKLKWKCNKGHIWKASPDVIKRGNWCPNCKKTISRSEKICKIFFEKLFDKKFYKCRPKFLKINKNGNLELDGYNKELNLAFEYNGIQHYQNITKYKNINHLKITKKRDKLKKIKCIENNVKLIIIPYYIKFKDMQKYIINECEKNNINVPNKYINFDYKKFDLSDENLLICKEIAKRKNLECLSSIFINNRKKLKYKCNKGHIFEMTPYIMKKNGKCFECIKYEKFMNLKNIAIKKNIKCLSDNYITIQTKLKWKCNKGHIWEASPNSIKNISKCPVCSGKKLTIEDIKIIAKNKNGKLLSKEYKNMNTKMIWKCNKEHIWKTTPARVKLQNHWCPICAGRGISNIRKEAILNGGESI